MAEWRVRVAAGEQRIAGRIRAIRKSEEAIERAQRKITRKQQQGKIRAAAETREYGCYILVFTTGTSRQATTRQVLECCRSRWRIELTFKRLKSIAHGGHVPKHDDRSSRAWLHGKLFVALLSQKLARIGGAIPPGATVCRKKGRIPSRRREFHCAYHRVPEAIAPAVGLKTVPVRWNQIAETLGKRNRKPQVYHPCYLSAYEPAAHPER